MPFADHGPDETMLTLLDAVQTGVLVIDHECRIVLANDTARRFFGDASLADGARATCHQLFQHLDIPCPGCPVAEGEEHTEQQKSLTLKRADGTDLFLKVHHADWQDHIVLTVQDLSREVTLLRHTDLIRKELQAKTVMQDHRQREVATERRRLAELIDHLPEALIAVDSDFTIQQRNLAIAALACDPEANTCFRLLGHDAPCPGCPALDGFAAADGRKKVHRLNDRYLTEIIALSPDHDGGLLLFRETTRQIQLIEEIRVQQENIQRNNELLSGLADFGAYLQKETDLQPVIEKFLALLMPVVGTDAAAVVVNDNRIGNIWCSSQSGVDEEAMNKLIRAYLSRDIQSAWSDTIPAESLPWEETSCFHLVGGNNRRVGLLVLHGSLADHDEQILLFTEPLGAYIHNRLLMLQLEEKANTDPLTGLYNRGYFHRALQGERDKFERYHIHYAVVVADVNALKQVNDQFGHEAGDRLIVTVSQLLDQTVRSSDVVARTGGDEFLVLLTDSTTEGAEAFVKRLEKQIFNQVSMEVAPDQFFPVTVSFGAVATDRVAPDSLLKEADRLMYRAKSAYYQDHPEYRRR